MCCIGGGGACVSKERLGEGGVLKGVGVLWRYVRGAEENEGSL